MAPFGPWPGVQSGGGNALDLILSFGHGVPDADDTLPTPSEELNQMWLSPTLVNDIGELGQEREWITPVPLGTLTLHGRIDRAGLVGGDLTIAVTADGETIACSFVVTNGDSGDFSATLNDYVAAGVHLGVVVNYGNVEGNLRGEFRLIGTATDAQVGPYTGPLLTAAYESFSDGGYPIVTDDDGVLTQPNRTGATAFDRVYTAGVGTTQAQLIPNNLNGRPSISGSPLIAPTLKFAAPTTGFWSAPAGGDFSPFTSYWVGRLNSGGAFGQRNCVIVRMPALSTPSLASILMVPIGAGFKLVWQWKEDASSNIATTPDLTGDLLGEVVLLTSGINSDGLFFFRLNNQNVALSNTDPEGSVGTDSMTDLAFTNEVDAVNKDEGAFYFIDGVLTGLQNAQMVAYFKSRFGLTF